MTGLMETENLDKVEASLTAAPNLIRKNKSMATEVWAANDNEIRLLEVYTFLWYITSHQVAADFAKIVLHMPGDLPIDHYTTFRHKIFVSLLIVSPQTVATYLCEQFISRNYTVSQVRPYSVPPLLPVLHPSTAPCTPSLGCSGTCWLYSKVLGSSPSQYGSWDYPALSQAPPFSTSIFFQLPVYWLKRLDVLDSLAAAAMELSDPTHCQEKTTDKLHDLSLDDRTSGQQGISPVEQSIPCNLYLSYWLLWFP